MMESVQPFKAQNGPAVTCSGLLCLFVGGPRDGERIRTDGSPYVRMLKRREVPIWDRPPEVGDGPEEHIYRRETLGSEDTRWHIYCHERLTIKDAMQMILDGYRHNR